MINIIVGEKADDYDDDEDGYGHHHHSAVGWCYENLQGVLLANQ